MSSIITSAAEGGILFIVVSAVPIVSLPLVRPTPGPEDLAFAAQRSGQLGTAALLGFEYVIAIALISVHLFAVLRQRHEALAIGYVGSGFFEAVLFVNVEIDKLSLINVSERYLAAEPSMA